MVTIARKGINYDIILSEGESIAVYVNGNPTEVSYTVGTGREAGATFRYNETIAE